PPAARGGSRRSCRLPSRSCLPIPGGAGRRPDHALGALQSLRRRPVCARACALPARAWTTPASTTNRETRPSLSAMAGRARRSVEVRREEILSTTVELLDRLGLAQTRVADVAVALDVSPALVFYHFGTKDDLVAEAFAHAVERDLHRLEKAARGDD